MSAVAQPRQTRRFGEKREAILAAATQLFNTHGVRGATLADVAARVGLVTNSVTYYYRRKDDLACACFLRSIDAFRAIAAEAATSQGMAARVQRFLQLHVALLADVDHGLRPPLMLFNDIRALPPPQSAAAFAAYTEMFRDVRALLEVPGSGRGARDALNARAHLLLSVPNWMRAWLDRYEPDELPRVAARAADIVLHGIAAPRSASAAEPGVERGWRLSPDVEPAADAFLRAATAQVNEQGYRGASVDRISARLNVTKGAFYHHNEHKDDLIAACFARSFAVIRQALVLAAAQPLPGWERCAAAGRALVSFQLSPEGPLLRTSATTALPDDQHRTEVRRTMRRLAGRLAAIIADGVADGSLRPVDPVIAAEIVTGSINAAAELQRWVPGARTDNASALFVRPMLEGLLAR